MVEVKDRSRHSADRALDGLTMTVPRGSIFGLVGQTGAGKIHLLRMSPACTGRIPGRFWWTANRSMKIPRSKARISAIPDELYYFIFGFHPGYDGFLSGFYPRFDRKRYEKLKEVFLEVDDEKRPIRRLSKGDAEASGFAVPVLQTRSAGA
jgi:ABC-2 type transport system ATP-binding protein